MSVNSEDCDYIFFDIKEFLTDYEKYPCLWDPSHEHFKDRRERIRCEEIIGTKLGIHDLRTLRRKIRSVRGTYNTEIRKIKQSVENKSVVYPPKLFWFPMADKFLRLTTDLPYHIFPLLDNDKMHLSKKQLLKKVPRKKGVKALFASPHKDQSIEENETEELLVPYKEETYNNEKAIGSCEEYEELESIDEEDSQDDNASVRFDALDEFNQNDYNANNSSASKLQTHTTKREGLSDVVDYLKGMASENEFTAFGRSVGVQLQNIPLELAVKLQMDIQAHITRTRLKYLQQKKNNNMESD